MTSEAFRVPARESLDALRDDLDAVQKDIEATRRALADFRPWSWWRFALGVLLPLVLIVTAFVLLDAPTGQVEGDGRVPVVR
jgi:hypothetical protein